MLKLDDRPIGVGEKGEKTMYVDQPATQIAQAQRRLVILPIGSCEQHGPYLPIDTDLRIATLLANKLTDTVLERDPLLLPPIPFSCSWEHKGLGTIALNVSTLAAVLHDTARSLQTWHTPMLLVLVNWHGGNDLLGALATEITATDGIPTTVIPAISQVGKAWDESGITTAKDIHAGAVETSIVQAFWPKLVAGTISVRDHSEPTIAPAKAQAVMQSLGIRAITPSGIWGAPEQADKAKGRRLVTYLVEAMRDQVLRVLELVDEQAQREEKSEDNARPDDTGNLGDTTPRSANGEFHHASIS